ncbi:MAG: DUF2974 domain-containing protein [Selenomonadales bacterium]|jgi:hypothetical protein|nr:DUF2974 domain-containing protein [Selenomonadales bacterium]
MANIIDYLKWRGDMSFSCDCFNEVDNLILSQLAYLNLDGVATRGQMCSGMTLSDLASQIIASEEPPSVYASYYYPEKVAELLMCAAKTTRYRDVELLGYVSSHDRQPASQFSAVTFSLTGDEHYIAFRGTGNSVAGWEENLRMSFEEEVPAHRQAVIYVNDTAADLKGRLHLGGHSKGGNIAVYAATHSDSKIRARIMNVYNNDGPGFHMNVIQSTGYQDMASRMHTLVPKAALVGMLLECGESPVIVDSKGLGIWQHDAFMWEVVGTRFVRAGKLSMHSRNLDSILEGWLDSLSMDERKQFVDALFGMMRATGADAFDDMLMDGPATISTMKGYYLGIDRETRRRLTDIVMKLWRESRRVYGKSIINEVNSLRRVASRNRLSARTEHARVAKKRT